MKKKLFGFIFAFSFMLTGALCFTACGETGISLHNKTYTFGEASYSFYITDGSNETKVEDIETFLSSHLDYIRENNGSDLVESATSTQALIDWIKQDTATYNSNITLVANAVITIGKEVIVDEATRESTFVLEQGGHELLRANIRTNTYNKNRVDGRLFGGEMEPMGEGFKLTDYNAKEGKINAVKVDFCRKVVDPINEGNFYFFYYRDAIDSRGLLFEEGNSQTLICRASTSLVSAVNN